ncbi:methyltransferase type 12 [Rhodoblastus acidophilus]|uniref:Methyltransferase type 12 n=1 Tax=Candidatus Rhodoblastus alkanivorans TaxID=2954117 RepID=A0ABS9Z3L3_9HYPH|nr:methyltransferase [Candidatus Rhodoblastus alkanivorans]MCI4677300.1 methyltransferase type 12 [Candidatus Rhodoblastus alkanivorans]MCI4682035.1 methyltransferase type 12 [Candidatus Rhodoblastus alkanivorans]MDI4643086.1 methyltransferase type 12 [Rhodoblastus acidophilus]
MTDFSVIESVDWRPEAPHLVVDEFLKTLVDARALKTAFELGLIDRLVRARYGGSSEALGRAVGADRAGMRLLIDLLVAGGVIQEHSGDVRLTAKFRKALQYRDLLEAKLDFAGFVLTDFADLFTTMVRQPTNFMSQARLFQLFDYRKCFEYSSDNYRRVRIWMRLTSTLTRYEAPAALAAHDFSTYRRMLDVGGNSGEFALRVCRGAPRLRATVFDLPLVCEIGLEHILGEPEQDRIGFVKGDLRHQDLPSGYDLITFKSMLHDWPARDAAAFLAKAIAALEPGGTILIFERGPLRFRDVTAPFSLIPSLLFFNSYRPASDYVAQFEAFGLENIQARDVFLDSPFYVVTGRKAAGSG